MKVNELMEATAEHKFIIMHEDDWDDYDDDDIGSSMLPIYVVSNAELKAFAKEHGFDVSDFKNEDETEAGHALADALENGLGKVVGKGKVSNPDPDLGAEGIKGPRGVTLLFPSLGEDW